MKNIFQIPFFLFSIISVSSFVSQPDKNYNLSSTSEVLLTSEKGDRIAIKENISFKKGKPDGNIILVRPDSVKQTIDGIGTSFTESSAFVLAHLDKKNRREVMGKIFSKNGANFSLIRTHIGACDFAVKGKYSYLCGLHCKIPGCL
jgi:glucosylceramidase